MNLYFVLVSGVIGLLIACWLLWDVWRTTRRQTRIDQAVASEWRTERRYPLGAAADPLHFRSLSDKATKGFKKANQKVIP